MYVSLRYLSSTIMSVTHKKKKNYPCLLGKPSWLCFCSSTNRYIIAKPLDAPFCSTTKSIMVYIGIFHYTCTASRVFISLSLPLISVVFSAHHHKILQSTMSVELLTTEDVQAEVLCNMNSVANVIYWHHQLSCFMYMKDEDKKTANKSWIV